MSASSALLTLSCVLGVAVASAAAAAAPFSPAAGLRPNVLFMVVDGEIFKQAIAHLPAAWQFPPQQQWPTHPYCCSCHKLAWDLKLVLFSDTLALTRKTHAQAHTRAHAHTTHIRTRMRTRAYVYLPSLALSFSPLFFSHNRPQSKPEHIWAPCYYPQH